MSEYVRWFDELTGGRETVGGKANSLGKLRQAGVEVPDGFVITTACYEHVLETVDIEGELGMAAEPAVGNRDENAANTRVRKLIEEVAIPETIETEILDAFDRFEEAEDIFVAVRSSAIAEDLPDASFAGQQETFLNVQRDDLLNRVRACWASLFSARAIYYRDEQGYGEGDLAMAVIVQRMVDATKSGVIFTKHPSDHSSDMIVEASWGLGEAVVSGAVTPDTYVVNPERGTLREATIGTKSIMFVRDSTTGTTVRKAVPPDQQDLRVLDDDEVTELATMGLAVEAFFDTPQDIEWAIENGSLYALQSRPITTREAGRPTTGAAGDREPTDPEPEPSETLIAGIGASPGTATGKARIVTNLDELDQVQTGEVLVTPMTTPDMVPAMERAVAIVTDEGGLTSHASIVSRELQDPAVVGTDQATRVLGDGQWITVDGERGVVSAGRTNEQTADLRPVDEPAVHPQRMKPLTGTQVKVNLSVPEAASRAAMTGADGVGLLRTEHLVLGLEQTPAAYIASHGADDFGDALAEGIRPVAEAFYPRPVRVRTLDAPTDEFRRLNGGEHEPVEENPMLGYRGIRRSIDTPDEFLAELGAFTRLYEMGYDNVELMLPLVTDSEEIAQAVELIRKAGIDLTRQTWGVMVETPASAICIDKLIDTGIDFVSFGTNDLTQFTLAIDRNNNRLAGHYSALHPAVKTLISQVIAACRDANVATSVCGQAGSDPPMIDFLVDAGISSISVNIDAVESTQEAVMRVEQRLLLDSVR